MRALLPKVTEADYQLNDILIIEVGIVFLLFSLKSSASLMKTSQ